jgi:hypothetical protein
MESTNAVSLKKFEEVSAAGGLHTNAFDSAQFMIALLKEKGLSRDSFTEMQKPQKKVPDWDEAGHWRVGVAIKQTRFGIRYMHSGNKGDFTCYFVLDRDKEKGICIFYQQQQNR